VNFVSAMDALIRITMKGAVNCLKHCDLQRSVNQQIFECGMCSMGVSQEHALLSILNAVLPLGSVVLRTQQFQQWWVPRAWEQPRYMWTCWLQRYMMKAWIWR